MWLPKKLLFSTMVHVQHEPVGSVVLLWFMLSIHTAHWLGMQMGRSSEGPADGDPGQQERAAWGAKAREEERK